MYIQHDELFKCPIFLCFCTLASPVCRRKCLRSCWVSMSERAKTPNSVPRAAACPLSTSFFSQKNIFKHPFLPAFSEGVVDLTFGQNAGVKNDEAHFVVDCWNIVSLCWDGQCDLPSCLQQKRVGKYSFSLCFVYHCVDSSPYTPCCKCGVCPFVLSCWWWTARSLTFCSPGKNDKCTCYLRPNGDPGKVLV